MASSESHSCLIQLRLRAHGHAEEMGVGLKEGELKREKIIVKTNVKEHFTYFFPRIFWLQVRYVSP